MTVHELIALLPIIAIASAAVIVMLAVAIRRHYRWTVALTLLGLLASLAVLPTAADLAPVQVTPLILVDRYALFFTGLIFIAGLVVTLLCVQYFNGREGQNEELYILLLTALLGGAVLVASSHFASFFIGLEILSVSLFALIAYPVKDRLPLEAAIKYLILSGVSSAFLLFGMALIYAELGTLSFVALGNLLPAADFQLTLVAVGIIMIIVALGFKLSLVPFHMWTPDVYQGAPAPITAFVATVSKGAIFALLLRYFILSEAYTYEPLLVILSLIAIASILVGNLLALLQDNVKRILAYSSIAHLGYLLVAFVAGGIVGSEFAVESVAFYLVAYFIMTLGAFGIVAALSSPEREQENLEDYQGLFWRRPGLAGIFTAMLLSLAGIPLTAGFIGKFYVFASGVDASLWLLVWAVVIGSGIGLYYYLRVVLVMARSPVEPSPRPIRPTPSLEGITLTVLAALLLWFGVYPGPFMETLRAMAKALS